MLGHSSGARALLDCLTDPALEYQTQHLKFCMLLTLFPLRLQRKCQMFTYRWLKRCLLLIGLHAFLQCYCVRLA